MTRHVLVVEDEPLIRMDAVMMLESAGLSVVDFDRADEAYQFAQSHQQDIAAVFTDVNLRGQMDGIDLAVGVLESDPSIAVVVTSGRYPARPQQLPENVTFLRKPWLPLDVLNLMQNAVAR